MTWRAIYLRRALPPVEMNWAWLVRWVRHGVIENMNLALARNTTQNGLLPAEIILTSDAVNQARCTLTELVRVTHPLAAFPMP